MGHREPTPVTSADLLTHSPIGRTPTCTDEERLYNPARNISAALSHQGREYVLGQRSYIPFTPHIMVPTPQRPRRRHSFTGSPQPREPSPSPTDPREPGDRGRLTVNPRDDPSGSYFPVPSGGRRRRMPSPPSPPSSPGNGGGPTGGPPSGTPGLPGGRGPTGGQPSGSPNPPPQTIATIAPLAPKIKEPKPEPVPKFTGDRGQWESFLVKLHIYFGFYPEYFATNQHEHKGVALLNLFSFPAGNPWAHEILSTIGKPKLHDLLLNFDLLVDTATTLWGPVNQVEDVIQQLEELKQTGKVADYYSRFCAIASKTGWNEPPLMHYFYSGLKPALKDMLVNVARPQHIWDYVTLCIDFENRILERIKEREKEGSYNPRPPPNQRTVKVNMGRLSPEERTRRMKEGLCFNCCGKGHMARDCK